MLSLCGSTRGQSAFRLALAAIAITLIVFVGFRISAFAHLFFTHAGNAVTQPEVAEAYAQDHDHARIAYVPRIIHQIFHNWTDASNEDLPADWAGARQTCIDLNPGWESRLWTAERSREFILQEYPAFIKLYDGFQNPVQRIDALRYYLMRHFGGIYIDLDNGCKTSLEPLRYYESWTTDGGQGALSNNILGSEPNHPFWILVTDSMTSYAYNYPLPYVTVMYATGQWFLTEMWEKYHRIKLREGNLTRVMMDYRDGAAPWTFFTHTRGGTWEQWDKRIFMWIGDHIATTVVLGFGAFAAVVCAGVLLWRTARPLWKGYAKVSGHERLS